MYTRVIATCFLGIYRYGGRFKDRPSLPIPYNPKVRSIFCGRRVLPGANVFGHFLFVYFLFKSPFYARTYRTFYDAAFDLPSTFFCFFITCLFVTFRTSSDVADRNMFLLYSGMASKSIRYTCKYISNAIGCKLY